MIEEIRSLVGAVIEGVGYLKRIAEAKEELVLHRRYESAIRDQDERHWSWEAALDAKTPELQTWWLNHSADEAVAANPHLYPDVARACWELVSGAQWSLRTSTNLARNKNTPEDVLEAMVACTNEEFIRKCRDAIKTAKLRLDKDDAV